MIEQKHVNHLRFPQIKLLLLNITINNNVKNVKQLIQ